MEQTVSWSRHRKIKEEMRNLVDLMGKKKGYAQEKIPSEQKV